MFGIKILFLQTGLQRAFATVLLQIVVYLQPLLAEKYKIAPVCLFMISHSIVASSHHVGSFHTGYASEHHLNVLHRYFSYEPDKVNDRHNHQCQYCKVYADLVVSSDFAIQTVIDRIQLPVSVLAQPFKHFYFELHRLFLMPQGRAPPLSL